MWDRSPEHLEACSYDYGRMEQRIPHAVARPESIDEAANIVRRASREGVTLVVRGGGHSQGGQTLTDSGVVLDTRGLDGIQRVGPDVVRAQGGAEWGKVVEALKGAGRLPAVLVDIGEATVGGTLSAGGVGSTSHRYGAQVGLVEQLDVVTGTGERVRCSPTRNRGLFDAVRGGQGQFGIIAEAWIRLRPAGERFRQHQLRYLDLGSFADDFGRLAGSDRFDHLRAEIRYHEQEIILSAGYEYAGEPDDEERLAGLRFDENTYTRDTKSVGTAPIHPKWAFSWFNHHPWRDWLLPWDALRPLLAQPPLEREWVPRRPWSWTGLYALGRDAIDAPLFMRPPGQRAIGYSVLCVMGQFQHKEAVALAQRLKEVDRTVVGLGGKAYLSGRTGYGADQWAEHYGDMMDQAIRWKREFDPKRVFSRAGMPF